MRIVIPIRETETEIAFRGWEYFIAEINSFSGNEKFLKLLDSVESSYIKNIIFNVKEKKDVFKNKIYKEHFEQRENELFEDYFFIIDIETTYKETDPFWLYDAIADTLLSKLSLILNLTYEFALDFLNGFVFNSEDLKLGETTIVHCHMDYAYEHSRKINWPKLSSIELSKTIDWFINNDISLELKSKNSAGRAINSFSHLFGDLSEKDSSFLFWSVLGIESILARGTKDISHQIKQKTNLLLGEPNEFKKKISKLYEYRSRLIHGDYNFPPKYGYDFDHSSNFEDEYWDYLAFSNSILIALIRKMINENKVEFEFEYKYCN